MTVFLEKKKFPKKHGLVSGFLKENEMNKKECLKSKKDLLKKNSEHKKPFSFYGKFIEKKANLFKKILLRPKDKKF